MLTTTVIIPTFNRARLLREALDAVLSQTCRPGEIIVVDDGSTDSTQDVIRSRGVRALHTPNRGKSAAVNLGLSHANGDWIWIVDDDDIPCPDALERLHDLLRGKPRARFAYGRHERFYSVDGSMRRLGAGYWSDCPDAQFHLATMEDYFAHQPGMLVARDVYETVGRFNETLSASEDYEMLVRIACRFDGARCDGVVFWQRLHDGDRGPMADRFGAADRETRWIEADKQIFLRVRQSLPLDAYLPRGAFFPEVVGRRRALLQRGCIMARKKLWTEAIADFSQAADIDCGPLSSDERSIVTRATFSKYGCDELITSPSLVRLLADIGRQRCRGPDITKSIARGLVWRIRKAALAGRLARATRLFRIVARLASPVSAHRGRRPPREPEVILPIRQSK
jgi:glycosyltransferase involved in cell wall biosynthesis